MQDRGHGQDKATDASLEENRTKRRVEPTVAVGTPAQHLEQYGCQPARAFLCCPKQSSRPLQAIKVELWTREESGADRGSAPQGAQDRSGPEDGGADHDAKQKATTVE